MKFFIKELEEGNDKLHISGRLNPDIHEYAKEFPEDINVDLHFSRFNQNVSANISIKTVGHFVCDRCLTSFDREISEEASIFFRLIFGGEYSDLDEEEDVVCLREDEKEYDLSDFISEHNLSPQTLEAILCSSSSESGFAAVVPCPCEGLELYSITNLSTTSITLVKLSFKYSLP